MDIHEVDEALAEIFGRYSQQWVQREPLLELIETVLGQRTTNAHARRAVANLPRTIKTGGAAEPDWAAVAALPYDTMVDLVRPAGLAKQKAGWVQAILTRLYLDSGSYALDHVAAMPNAEATRYLCSLPGVGPHTAALLLVFAFNRPGVMPVDTHVHRVARRLGWADADATAGAVQRAVEAAAPDRLMMDLHVNLILLGQAQCGAGTPDCPECPLNDLCRHARQQSWF